MAYKCNYDLAMAEHSLLCGSLNQLGRWSCCCWQTVVLAWARQQATWTDVDHTGTAFTAAVLVINACDCANTINCSTPHGWAPKAVLTHHQSG